MLDGRNKLTLTVMDILHFRSFPSTCPVVGKKREIYLTDKSIYYTSCLEYVNRREQLKHVRTYCTIELTVNTRSERARKVKSVKTDINNAYSIDGGEKRSRRRII